MARIETPFWNHLTALLWAALAGACGSALEPAADPALAQTDQRLSREDPLQAARAFWEEFAPLCSWYPSKENCEDGDMTLFNGLLCVSGQDLGCQAVRASQGADGRFWRSPRRVDGNLGQNKSFSRDMTMGVLLYLARTRDTAAAGRWLDWIDRNRPCVMNKPWGGGCLVRGLYRVCRDDENTSCTLTPGVWALMGRVWGYLGLSRHDEMKRWEGSDGDVTAIEAEINEPGYELHLAGVGVLLKQYMGVSSGPRQEVASTLAGRQPNNPFFLYLRDGVTEEIRQKTLALCPHRENGTAFRKFQWSWERSDSSEAWRESMGWECIFLHNLIRNR